MTAPAAGPHPALRTLTDCLSKATGLATDAVAAQLRPPPKPEMGDYAFPCFELAKQRKLAPPELAKQLGEALSKDPAALQVIEKAEAAGPFLNFRIRPGLLCAGVLEQVRAAGSRFGDSDEGKGKTIVIDYSSPNFAKPFHTGHLITTILGASLVRIFRALGYTVVGVNHVGDWGTQCGYQFAAWRRADPKEREAQLVSRGLDYLVDLYVEINEPAKRLAMLRDMVVDKNISTQPEKLKEVEAQIAKLQPEVETINTEARALFKKLEDGDGELRALWQRMRDATLKVLQKSYDRLGIRFESDAGEAFYEPYLKPLIEEWKAKGVLVMSEGAWVIPLDEPGAKHKRPPCIVVKSDGGTKYETRDLAAAIYRKKTYDFHKNLYVVSVQQNQHFSGFFLALQKAGYAWAKECVHVSFGIMQVKEGDAVLPMSTRAGRMIPLEELLDRMVGIVRSIVDEKNPALPSEQKARVAEAVGVGAIAFWIQSRRRISNIVFDWKLATSPDGDTGPYVQYTYARACSILKKHGAKIPPKPDLSLLREPEEAAVAKALERFPAVLREAAEAYEPSVLATWLLETARAFNDFYNKHQVLKAATPELVHARLALVDGVRTMLAKGLGLIGLATPEEM